MATWQGIGDVGIYNGAYGGVTGFTVTDHRTGRRYVWSGHGHTVNVFQGRDAIDAFSAGGREGNDATRGQVTSAIRQRIRLDREQADRRAEGGAIDPAVSVRADSGDDRFPWAVRWRSAIDGEPRTAKWATSEQAHSFAQRVRGDLRRNRPGRRQDGGPVAADAAAPPPAAVPVPSRLAQVRRDALPFGIAGASGLLDGYLNASGGPHLLTWKSSWWRLAQLVGAVGLAHAPQVPLRAAEAVAVDGAFGVSSRIFEAVSQAMFHKGG